MKKIFIIAIALGASFSTFASNKELIASCTFDQKPGQVKVYRENTNPVSITAQVNFEGKKQTLGPTTQIQQDGQDKDMYFIAFENNLGLMLRQGKKTFGGLMGGIGGEALICDVNI